MDETAAGGATNPPGATAHPSAPPAVLPARAALATTGVHLMPPAAVRAQLRAGPEEWAHFAAHWEDLSPDPYASEQGTHRRRRYGQFALTPATGELRRLPHLPFVQPEESNPLYVAVDRHFDPLTDAFVADPVLRAVLALLGHLAGALDAAPRWTAKVHPFRVVATPHGAGSPTPEGRHRDGVTLVSSLLIGRRNATGGSSTVFAPDGRALLTTTLDEPAALLLSDDRATLHGVSPVRPADPSRPAHRDVLVTTLTPAG
ncbi:2OG-Fe dioxygenase family protein [Streptomyces lydicus]|uniref:2OG-Fe dioxygenase family protein n=1 Tax=Streptomyces lydicus TaxID=47763 RepID=UPI00369A453F